MDNANLLLSPPVAFLLFLGIGGLIYLFGRLIGMPYTPEPGKKEPYACGEDFRPDKFTFGYSKFFVAALFFTVMHVAVLTVATVPGGPDAFKAFGYLVAIAVSISILFVNFE